MSKHLPTDQFLARLLNRQLSEEEQNAWDLDDQQKDLRNLINAADQLKVPHKQSKEDAWEQMMQRIQSEEDASPVQTPVIPLFTRLKPWMTAAAAVAVLIVSYLILTPSSSQISAPLGQQLTHQLPDQSTVILNAGSEISYDAESFAETRVLELKGEAFFKVAPGKSFIVDTEEGDVEVLGTSFNTRARDGKMEVICYTGKVKVTAESGSEEVILTPGQSANTYQGGLNTAEIANLDAAPQWTKGVFSFKKSDFSDVVAELERQFDVQVQYENMEGRTLTITFFNDDMELALKTICEALDLNYIFTDEDKSKVVLKPAQQ
ncbi:FecR domain-containing protein [Pontibacter sp. G13]|uniref:FecR family protein n=1 Tax=Pontibacter sp. G13 TaxID=3074898 RepID=UPI00288B3B65|nr:FecR domain-containing protein [Pontibacter sp. G13]WNJ15936.1 FecR domain-containing protein [Pontibacter sp. G13]